MDFVSYQDLFNIGRDEALAKNSNLTREVIERNGTDANAVYSGAAAVGDAVVGQLIEVEAGLYLDSAKKKQLDRLVFDRYGLTRKPATPAVGSVQFTTTAPTVASFPIPIGATLKTADGKTFLTTATAIFPSASTGPITVAVRSAAAGLNQQASIGTITNIGDTLPGSPTDLAVTNIVATAGADDEELDDSLRNRARRYFTTARRGTVEAIEAAALGVLGVSTASAFEVLDEFGRPARGVQLVISDAFTEALVSTSPTPNSYEVQSQVLASNVSLALNNVRAGGIYVNVSVAKVVLQAVQLGLNFQAGVNADLVALQARAAIVAYMNSLAPGEFFNPTVAVEKLRVVPGLIVMGNEIISPPGEVFPLPLEVLRTTMGLVVALSLQPDQALQGSANPDGVT